MPEAAEGFDAYVAARQRRLVRTAFLLTGDQHEAEDLVQSALARTYRSWRRIRDPAAVDPYVYRVMVNLSRSWWRQAWRRYERSTATVPDRAAESIGDFGEQDDEVWQLVCALPRRQRAVIVLRFYEDMSPAEVAELLDCSTGTVASQTSRALTSLRQRMTDRQQQTEAGVEEDRHGS